MAVFEYLFAFVAQSRLWAPAIVARYGRMKAREAGLIETECRHKVWLQTQNQNTNSVIAALANTTKRETVSIESIDDELTVDDL